METIRSADGTPIAYWRDGTGDPLLLVHGTICDHTTWAAVQPALVNRNFSVYAMDRRGRGRSGDRPAYSLRCEAVDIAAVVDSIPGSVNVVAHSFGALCALEAVRLTRNVRRLILYEPPMPMGGRDLRVESAARMQAHLDNGEKENALLIFLTDVFMMPAAAIAQARASVGWSASVDAADTIPRECQVVDAYAFDATRFRSMQTPTVLFVGADSPPNQHRIAEALRAGLLQSRIVELSGQHHLAITAAPGLFTQEVARVLMETEPPAGFAEIH
jgi:pimeloyl-ACP methyl ester carboxylesterase